jgi:dihydrofolate reductase
MRPLILKMDMSLDGFVGQHDEQPAWPTDFYDDELHDYVGDLISGAGVHVMGRGAYEEMAPYWQASTEPFAALMNDLPKAVFSRTLSEATWPVTTIHREIESGIAELKAQDGGPLITYGGATFAQELTRRGLVDEYRINVHPIALGSGFLLFGGSVALELQDVRRFATGSVAYTYTPR